MAPAPMPQDQSQGAPQQGQPDQGGGGSPSAGDLVNMIHQAMMQLGQMMSKAKGIPPDAIQKLQGIIQDFESLVQNDLGGSSNEPEGDEGAQPQQGVSSPEAGGNSNAKPY